MVDSARRPRTICGPVAPIAGGVPQANDRGNFIEKARGVHAILNDYSRTSISVPTDKSEIHCAVTTRSVSHELPSSSEERECPICRQSSRRVPGERVLKALRRLGLSNRKRFPHCRNVTSCPLTSSWRPWRHRIPRRAHFLAVDFWKGGPILPKSANAIRFRSVLPRERESRCSS